MLQTQCWNTTVLRLGKIPVIGIQTTSSVCTAHCCITLPSRAASVPPLPVPSSLPLPLKRRGRKEEWLPRGASAAKVASQELKCHPGARCAFLTKTLCRPPEEGSCGRTQRRAALWWRGQGRSSLAVTIAVCVVAQKVTSRRPCTLPSGFTATGSVPQNQHVRH